VVLEPAGGSSFGGDFLVSAADGKTLELALVDVSGKGIDAGTVAPERPTSTSRRLKVGCRPAGRQVAGKQLATLAASGYEGSHG